MAEYLGRNGARYELGALIGRGGEGDIYEVVGQPGIVAKIYKDAKYTSLASVTRDPHDYLRRKICCMLDSPLDGWLSDIAGASRILTVAWPQDTLSMSSGLFAGFTMPRVDGKRTIHTAYRERERQQLFRHYTWRSAIAIAYNLAASVAYLHDKGIVVGDFNSNNIMIDGDGYVTLIDADSFNVSNPKTGSLFKCMVGVAEVLAPELQGRDLSQTSSVFTKQSDCFSLAIHLFHLLANNTHPFGCASLASTGASSSTNPIATNIARGQCPYVSSSTQKGQDTVPDLESFPQEIRDLFDRVFTYDVTTALRPATIARRPSAAEWRDALERLHQSDFTNCANGHVYLKQYATRYGMCPWCAVNNAQARKRTPSQTAAATATSATHAATQAASQTTASAKKGLTGALASVGASNQGSTIRRESWPLWVAYITSGMISGPLISGSSIDLAHSIGLGLSESTLAGLLVLGGGVAGGVIAHYLQERYQKAYNAWPWLLVCLLMPLVDLGVLLLLGLLWAILIVVFSIIVGVAIVGAMCGAACDG